MKWVIHMEYRISLQVNKHISMVSKKYLEQESMLRWMNNLISIETLKGALFEEGSEGYLVFEHQGKHAKMKITILKSDLPHTITAFYEVQGAYNKCVNTFEVLSENQTMWHMDVLFKFDFDNDIPIEMFKEKTRQSMLIYKDFIEHE